MLLMIKGYYNSRVHQERKRACRGSNDPRSQLTRYNSNGSGPTTSTGYGTQPVNVPQRPPLQGRTSSNSSSVVGSPGSTFGSPSFNQSRRPSDAMSSLDSSMRGRAGSISSVSSEYGTKGGYGWEKDPYGNDGGYGWGQPPQGPTSYYPPPSYHNSRR